MDKDNMQKMLQYLNLYYDAEKKMIKPKFALSENYINLHSSFTEGKDEVHSINYSVKYAYLLLKINKKFSDKVNDILETVLSLQQNNPLKSWYGLWPYYLEEPLDIMPYPDFNQAVYIPVTFLQIYNEFKNIIPGNIKKKIEQACCAAAIFIVNRNTELQYSHIVTIECYVCALCGEYFSRPEFENYGMQKIEKFMYFVFSNGDFFEFNSPTMSLLMAASLNEILQKVNNVRILNAARRLNKFLWNGLASHYHYATGQFAGPFARSYRDFLQEKEQLMLSSALHNKTNALNIGKFLPLFNDCPLYDGSCPPQFYPFFSGEKKVEYSQRLISHGAAYPYFACAQIATTYMRPKYSLGSFNREEFWEERRPIIAHFGTRDNLYSMRVRCLLNTYDFSSAQLHCIQVKNSILGHICFSTNRGIMHMDFDKFDSRAMPMSDFRVRFEINGNSANLNITQKGNEIIVKYEDILFSFNYGFFKFGELQPHIEFSKADDKTTFDLVFYSGEEKKINLEKINCAICQFALHISENGHIFAPAKNKLTDDYLVSEQKNGSFDISLKTPVKPDNWKFLMLCDDQEINGVKFENFARNAEESALQYEFIANSDSEVPIAASSDGNNPIDDILTKTELLSSLKFEEMQPECENILKIAKESNISTEIVKRFAVRMLTNIFEAAKYYSLMMEKSIKYEYSNIYISLSQSNSIEAVEKIINSVLSNLQIDYRLYSENEKKKNFVDTITEIIKHQYSDPSFSLTYLAEKTGFSEAYISKAFHKRTGISYLQYLTRIRMEHAKKMLDSGETNANKIAENVGYENMSSFLRAFKKYTGLTVSMYTKKINSVK